MLSTNQEDALRQRVLITGASSGIGQACAVAFCADGAEVIGLDRSPGGATAAAAGSRFRGVLADLADPVQIESAFEQVDGLFRTRLFAAAPEVDEAGRLRMDGKELEADVQREVERRLPLVENDTIDELSDFAGYQQEFLRLFGFGLTGVDYDAEVDPVVGITELR